MVSESPKSDAAGGMGYVANEFIVLPYQYRAAVEKALPFLDAESAAKTITTLEKLPVPERSWEFLLIANKLKSTSRVPNELRIDAARSAFLLSIHHGNARARLVYGMALAEGQLGLPEPDGAKEQYAKALKVLLGKAQQGDPTSTYTYALMLASGLGIEQNKSAATSLVKSVWKELPLDDVSRISLH